MNKKALIWSGIIFFLITFSYFYYNYSDYQRSKESISGSFEYRFGFFDIKGDDANMLVDSYTLNLYEDNPSLSLNIREYPKRNIKDKTVRIYYYLDTDENSYKKELNGPNLDSSNIKKVTVTKYTPDLPNEEIEIGRKYFEKEIGPFSLDLNFSKIDLIDSNDKKLLIKVYFEEIKFKKYDYYLIYNINDEYSNKFVFRYDDRIFEDGLITDEYTGNEIMLKANQPLIHLKLKRDRTIINSILVTSLSIAFAILAFFTRLWGYYKEDYPKKNQKNNETDRPNLIIRRIRWEEVRRGWIRIHETKRNGIKKGTLIKLCHENKSVRRIVLGIPEDYPNNGDEKKIEDYIYMDEDTRESLGLEKYTPGEHYRFVIKKDYWVIGSILFYFKHPDFVTNFACKLALISIIIALILGVISILT